MKIIKILALMVVLAPSAFADETKEPLGAMSRCLIMHNWTSWGIWRFEVYALAGDKILIGNKENHFRVAASEPGYSHVVSGKAVANYPEATSLTELGSACRENCPVNHKERVGWFKRRCKAYAS